MSNTIVLGQYMYRVWIEGFGRGTNKLAMAIN